MKRLTNTRFAQLPAFSPDGEWIAYQTVGNNFNREIRRIRIDGSDDQLITDLLALNSDANHWQPWSADGSYIVFTSNHLGNREIFSG